MSRFLPSGISLRELRADTPGCLPDRIHLNSAGSSLVPRPVVDAVTDYLRRESEFGGYETARECEASLERFYPAAAELIGCEPSEVAFVENATRAWQAAFYAIPFSAGDRIITCEVEYASNYIAYLQRAKRDGIAIDVVPSRPDGSLDIERLADLVTDRTRLITITHIPTNGGLVNPAWEVGRIARAAGVPYLLDACQSVGQIDVDVASIGCDMLSVTGRKFLRGPRGTGFLYMSHAMQDRVEPAVLDLHSATWSGRDSYRVRLDARRFETWEQYLAGKIGLTAAIDYCNCLGIDWIEDQISQRAALLRDRLSGLSNVVLQDVGTKKCGIVSFEMPGLAPEDVQRRLADKGISVSVVEGWHTRLDSERRGLDEIVRASVHYYTSEDEIERAVDVIANL